MPTPTYDLIEEKVLGSAQASVTFSSIPGTYKDLVLEMLVGNTTDNWQINVTYNGDTGSNYSYTYLSGSGTAAASGRASSTAYVRAFANNGQPTSLSGTSLFNVFSYANTNVNKTSISRDGSASRGTEAIVGLWRSTSAITSLTLTNAGNQFLSGSTFRLWGVAG